MRLLVAESDPALSAFLRHGLDAEHYAVEVAGDEKTAEQLAGQSDYDLLILDLNTPSAAGIQLLKQIRERKGQLAILALTAHSRPEDRVLLLDQGADDCMLKPFAFRELSARVRALLRRGRAAQDAVLRLEDLELDRIARTVHRAQKSIELTPKEFQLLEFLLRNHGKNVTRSMIIEQVWNLSFDTRTNVVDVYINYKAHRAGDLIIIQLAESTNSSQQAAAQTSRTFAASSSISEFFGTPGARSGIQNLFSPTSSQALNGKGQTSLTTTLQSTLSGTVVEVLPDGNMVVEAKRDVDVSNQKHTLIVRGIVRPGDISPTNTVLSTQVAHLEVELKGKGVISDSVRSPIAPLRLMLWILGF
jgi:two-component system, OmpR family, copper resistance phosphate regulon response regulator CusR